MKVAVVGTGYVGLVTGACFAEFGLGVACADRDAGKIDGLNAGRMPIYEPGLEEIVRRNVAAGRLGFTTDVREAVAGALVVFVAVPTPAGDAGATDLSHVEDVAREIGACLDDYKAIVVKSTVPALTAGRVREVVAAAAAEAGRPGVPFSVCSNPEFLREGSAVEDFMRPDRVVIGADDERSAAILKELYKPLDRIEVPLVVTGVATAELIKHASNAFLATKVAFVNEIANLCERVGADVRDVAHAMGLDERIGRLFLQPGPGYGGSCFPKDTRSLVRFSEELGVRQRVVEATVEANEAQRGIALDKIERMVGGVRGRTLAVLGLSFKPNTDDVRESPAIAVVRGLQERGARVRAFDPQAMAPAAAELEGVAFCKDAYDAAQGSDALVVATEWDEFRGLDLERVGAALAQPVVIDLRNVYGRTELERLGFRYAGVGR